MDIDPDSSYDTESLIDINQNLKNHQTIELFIQLGGFVRPFRVVLDCNLFAEIGFTPEMIRVLLNDPEARFFVTSCIQAEIVSRNKFKGINVPSPILREIQLLRCNHDLNTFDTNCIKKLLKNYNPEKYVVVTANPEFAAEINNNLQCLVILYVNGKLIVKPISIFMKSIHHQMVQDDFSRLKMRLLLFNFVESNVGVGGDTFFECLSQQLNLGGHQATRTLIVNQLEEFEDRYASNVEGQYGFFLANVMEQGTWPCEVVLQAAADLFRVRIALLSGCHDHFLMEWWPHQQPDTRNFRVVYVGYLEGLRYTSLTFTADPHALLQQETRLNITNLFEKDGQKLHSSVYQMLRGRYSIDGDDNNLLRVCRNRVKRRLKTYCFKEKPILGDDNCCPRSIGYNKYRSQGTHLRVRSEIIEQLENHPEMYRNLVYYDYVAKMSYPGEWGDDTFLQAAADLYNCRFTSIAPTPQEIAYDYSPPGFDVKSCAEDFFLSDLGIHNNAIYHDRVKIARRAGEAADGV